MNKYNFYTEEEDLSTRSLNVIKTLGGISSMLQHFKNHGTFTNLPFSGKYTNMELTSFCNFLINHESEIIIRNKESELKKDFSLDNPDISRLEKVIEEYEVLKESVSVRAKNVLTQLENDIHYELNTNAKINFIKTFFIEDYNFKKIRKIGFKTNQELNGLKEKLLSSYLELSEIKQKSERSDDYIPRSEDEIKLSGIKYKVFKFFSFSISRNEIEKLFKQNKYCFDKLLTVYLLNLKLNNLTRKVFELYYFDEGFSDLSLIAKKINCSKERIRQIVFNLKSKVLPKTVTFILNNFNEIPSDLPTHSEKDILQLEEFSSFTIDSINYSPNQLFSCSIYSILLEKEFKHINEVISSSSNDINSFVKCEECFFISKQFIESTHFEKFILWIDMEIYHFESIEFNYTMSVLIERFFKENEIDVSKKILNELNLIIEKVKRTDWSDIKFKVSKNKKRINDDLIIGTAFDFIKTSNSSRKTAQILENLHSNFLDVPKYKLLKLLNGNKSRFKQLGNGIWALRDSEDSKNIEGTLVDIVYTKLNSSVTPLHISELLDYINEFHKISENSLRTNLRAKQKGVFEFFNCSYVGLKSKKYEPQWYKLPVLNPRHIYNSKINSKIFKNVELLADYLFYKYGYPRKHIIYLKSKKKK